METAVVCYSFTGNNKALAEAAAAQLSAELIEVSEEKPRRQSAIILDILFNRTPKVRPLPAELKKYDRILFVAPVWLGKAASPLRAYLKQVAAQKKTYAYASVSGGALNTNPGLADDIEKRAGTAPAAVIDLHIADLLPPEPKPTMKLTSNYRLNNDEIARMAGTVAKSVKKAMGL